jgi:PAS domain-containing protein
MPGGTVAERPRILVFEGADHSAAGLLQRLSADSELVRVDSVARGLSLLRNEHFDGVYADTHDPAVWERAGHLLQAETILEALDEGVALVDPQLRITWSNATFQAFCGGEVSGRGFYEVVGSPDILGPDYSPFHTALAGKAVTTRLHCRDNRYLELHVTPVYDAAHKVTQLISLARDVTAEAQQRQKLDALHQAGQELAALDSDQLAEMSVEERVELLKLNIRRFTHDLLHYDVVEIRLLDRQTGRRSRCWKRG